MDVDRWRSRLSERAVVLVQGKWTEPAHPRFQFEHAGGLQVVGVGEDTDDAVRSLLNAAGDPELAASIRDGYARLGRGLRDLDERIRELESERALFRSRVLELAGARREHETRIKQLNDELRAIHSSRWWRLGVPLRAAKGAAARLVAPGQRNEPPRPAARPGRRQGDSPRVVFVSGYPGRTGHTYRVVRMASALAAESFNTAIVPIEELRARLAEAAEADVLWIWRTGWSGSIPDAVDEARRRDARIVFDADDLVFCPELARPDVIDGIRTNQLDRQETRAEYERLQWTLLECDHAAATTEPLARHMRGLGKPTVVIPNCFDQRTLDASRAARAFRPGDGLVRVGYASGSFTHQRDFAVAVRGIVRVLAEHPRARLVLFRPKLDLSEFPEFSPVASQVEWRAMVPLEKLQGEYARFDVNIAPLEVGNPFCEAKSELKLSEAALVGVPTVASPTEPFAAAISDGETGFLAASDEEWYTKISGLVRDEDERRRVGDAACVEALRRFGPERRTELVVALMRTLLGEPAAAPAESPTSAES
jgi:glycosyltransferase involved in cell wall biosynthesis